MKRIISASLAALIMLGASILPFRNIEPAFSESSVTAEAAANSVELTIKGTENYTEAYNVYNLVNKTRSSLGLSKLTMDKQLTEAAMQRAAEISVYGSHKRPDGSACNTAAPRKYTFFAENIALGHTSADSVMASWVKSQGHYEGIISKNVKSIGVGCFTGSNGVTCWVQIFDSETGTDPKLSGKKQVSRSIDILPSNLSLSVSSTDSSSSGKTSSQLKIYQGNTIFTSCRTEIAASEFNYTSLNPKIASVDSNGKVTKVSAGSAKIKITLKEDSSVSLTTTITFKATADDTPSVRPSNPTIVIRVDPYSIGDVTGDGFINASDSSSVLAHYAVVSTGGNSTFTSSQKSAADVNHDKTIDSSDASSILAYYAYIATGGTIPLADYLSKK